MSGHAFHRVLIVFVIAMGLVVANPALAADDYAQQVESPSAGAMAVDAVLVRPLSLAATVLGTGLFLVALPFSLSGANTGKADKRLVVEPLRYTFQRPLGDFQAPPEPHTDADNR